MAPTVIDFTLREFQSSHAARHRFQHIRPFFGYDKYALTALSGTPQHVSITGSHGNLETVDRWVTGTTYLRTTSTHYDTGAANTATDVNSAATTYSYPDAKSTCGNAFPTIAHLPLNLSTSVTYDCVGGVVTSATDVNGKVTTVDFVGDGADPFWRPERTTDALGNVTTFDYSPTTSESALVFNGSASTNDNLTTLDGLGRVKSSQRRQSPSSSNYDTISYTFDADGRLYSTSVPCVKAAGVSCPTTPATTQTYDALGRPLVTTDAGGGTATYTYTKNDVLLTIGPAPSGENTKRRQYEYDGLGRLTSVCEITSATGSGPCGQAVAQTGFLTSYTYNTQGKLTRVTQEAQTRTYVYDDLGRMTSESNPESGQTTYAYDSASGCNTSNGDPVKKMDAVGNVSCLNYDALHRVTSITYTGPYATNTPTKTLVYDSATVNGFTMLNAKGRLAEAYTGSVGSKITDLGFSYTTRGEQATLFESTPHSGGYYSVSMSYWANSALNTLGGLSLPTITYNADGEGRPTTVSASTGQNPVTGTTYNTRSQATALTFGSLDSAAFAFDANTGRQTSYSETINGTAISGTLSWNQNGTLAQLTVTDPFNAANAQTCNYLYDDLGRIGNKPGDATNQSVDCGSTKWQQKFAYDQYGNLTKSGSLNWIPGYSATTNRYTLGGTSYDANGNLLNDTFNTYTWDVEGHNVATGAVTMTYDALGREVERNNSGTINQFVYALGTKVAVMNAQSVARGFVPLPGGVKAVYNPSLTTYRVPDWQGSMRIGSNYNRAYCFSVAFAPFGEQYDRGGSWPVEFTFAGNDNETTTNTNPEYDALYRKVHTTQGRWISPDPAGIAAVDPADPQTWNRYAYVRNTPLVLTDPTGMRDGIGTNTDQKCGWVAGPGWGPTFCGWEDDAGGKNGSKSWCILDGVISDCAFVYQNLGGGAVVNCPQCKPGQMVGADNKIYAWLVDFFRKDCEGPVSGGVAGALGNCTTTWVGSGPVSIATLLDIWYRPGESVLPSAFSLQTAKGRPTASVSAYRPAGPVAKPGAVECITNPGDSLEALAPNANQPSADPGFPGLIYANRSGRQQLNPEGDAVGAGVAVIMDYLLAAFSCLTRR